MRAHRANAPTLICLAFGQIFGFMLITGCGGADPTASKTEDTSTPSGPDVQSATSQIAAGEEPDIGGDTFSPVPTNPSERGMDLSKPANRLGSTPVGIPTVPDPTVAGQVGEQKPGPFQLAPGPDAAPQPDPEYRLPVNMSAEELVVFLSNADKDMKALFANPKMAKDRDDYASKMVTIAQLKLKASRELKNHAESTDKQKVDGARGEMQSLSHLAAMKDPKAGNALIQLATENLKSDDEGLVADSRIVLIGFALESMESGLNKNAPNHIVGLVNQFEKDGQHTNVPALMVMAQARHMLSQYGYDEEAAAVREKILELFAGSADPTVAQLAAQAAGNLAYDEIDKRLQGILKGDPVSADEWSKMANELIDQAPDLVTVKYLAGASLEFESLGKQDLVEATFGVLQKRFQNKDEAPAREVELASKLRNAREAIIGSRFELNLKSLSGAPMPISDFKGKIVLMPFWAIELPGSLQVVPVIKKVVEAHPDDVVVVGLNFDSAAAPLEEFMLTAKLDFPSYRAPDQSEDPENSILAHFGLASLPFVVVLDQDAKVAAIDFRGDNLESAISRLLESNKK